MRSNIKEKNYCIIIFNRPLNEGWTLQIQGWPPQTPRFADIGSDGKWEIEIYVGNIKELPIQREFNIHAVALNKEEALQLMNTPLKTPDGIPFFMYKSDITEQLEHQLWSEPVIVILPQAN